jgi:hypothetical protein
VKNYKLKDINKLIAFVKRFQNEKFDLPTIRQTVKSLKLTQKTIIKIVKNSNMDLIIHARVGIQGATIIPCLLASKQFNI